MSVLNELKKTADKDWHRADIIAGLKKNGWSLRLLADEVGFSYNTVKSALDKPYPKMERIIADAVGVPAEVIWPERYEKRNFKPRLTYKLTS